MSDGKTQFEIVQVYPRDRDRFKKLAKINKDTYSRMFTHLLDFWLYHKPDQADRLRGMK